MAPRIGGVERRTLVEVCETQSPEVDLAGIGDGTPSRVQATRRGHATAAALWRAASVTTSGSL